MASGSKSSTLPSKLQHSGNFPPANKGFLGKIRQKLRFGHRRQYSFEEKDGVVLTGVYSRRLSEESGDHVQRRNHASEPLRHKSMVDHRSRRGQEVVHRTLSSKSTVSESAALRCSQTENHYAELTQEERRKSLIVERDSGLFSAALNSADLKNDLIVPDDSAIDLDKLSGDPDSYYKPPRIDFDMRSSEQECIEDIDPGYETLEEVRQRIADRLKYSDNLRQKSETATSGYIDQSGNHLTCSPDSSQNITRDSGLGSPGVGEEGENNLSSEGFPCYGIDDKNPHTGIEDAPTILHTDRQSPSQFFGNGTNHTQWNSDETKDIYDNPQVLFRKQSQKVASSRNCNSVQTQESSHSSSSSDMFIENVSGCVIDNDVMESSVFIRQKTPVDLEGPPLPARNYSVYIDETNNKINNLIKSETNKNAIHISYSDNKKHIMQQSENQEPLKGQPDLKMLKHEETMTLTNGVRNGEPETSDFETHTNSVITTMEPCFSGENESQPKHTSENSTCQSDRIPTNSDASNMSVNVIDSESNGIDSVSTDILHESNDSGFGSCMYPPSLVSSKQSCDDHCSEAAPLVPESVKAEIPQVTSVSEHFQAADSEDIAENNENFHVAHKETCDTYAERENGCESKLSVSPKNSLVGYIVLETSAETCEESKQEEHKQDTSLPTASELSQYLTFPMEMADTNQNDSEEKQPANESDNSLIESGVKQSTEPDGVDKASGDFLAYANGYSLANASGDSLANASGDSLANASGDSLANATRDSFANASGDSFANATGDYLANASGDSLANASGDSFANASGDSLANASGYILASSEVTAVSVQPGPSNVSSGSIENSPQVHFNTENDSCTNSEIVTEKDVCVQAEEYVESNVSSNKNVSINLESGDLKQSSTDSENKMKAQNLSSFNEAIGDNRGSAESRSKSQNTKEFVTLSHGNHRACSNSQDSDVSQKTLSLVLVPQEEEQIHMCLSEVDWDKIQSFRNSEVISPHGNNGELENMRNDVTPPAVPPRRPRKKETVKLEDTPQHAFLQSMKQLKDCGWYWGPLNWDEAEATLAEKTEGSFLVRDSSDDRYILSLSFKSHDRVHHTRIEHHKGKFSFWSQPDSHSRGTIKEFVDLCIENSRNGRFLYFIRPSQPGYPPIPIHLKSPISRFMQVQSLHHMCRFTILQSVRRDYIDDLPVPKRVKDYLKRPQYYVEMEDDDI
ncbi:hypothetical protein ScPMuIL_016924 [Solemya velum]